MIERTRPLGSWRRRKNDRTPDGYMHTPSPEIRSSHTEYFFSRGLAAAMRRAKDGRDLVLAMKRLLVGAARPGVEIGSGRGGDCTRKPRHRDRTESALRH